MAESMTMAQAQVLAPLQASQAALLDSPRDIVAYLAAALAAALVVAGALVRTMIPLRWLAVASDLGFVIYGVPHPQHVTLLVAALLLPVNIHRAREMMRLTRCVKTAESASDLSGLWLRPYMKPRCMRKGAVLFRKGELADHLLAWPRGRSNWWKSA